MNLESRGIQLMDVFPDNVGREIDYNLIYPERVQISCKIFMPATVVLIDWLQR